MNPASSDLVRWSRRRWSYTVAALVVAQAVLVFALGQRERTPRARPAFATTTYLAADDWSAWQLAHKPDLPDALLLALPNLNGFSGPAWLKFATLEHQPARWSEPPEWLPLAAPTLGQSFSQFVATNRPPPSHVADKPLPPLTRYEPNFPADPLPQKSRLRLQGELATRPLVAPLEIKSWPHSDLLSNTTVQVVVNAEGLTISARLLTGSGRREADLHVLALAGAARFQPGPRDSMTGRRAEQLTWGRLVFLWHTLPLPATNPPPSPP